MKEGELVPKVGLRVGYFEGLAEGNIDVGNVDGDEVGEHVGFEEGVVEGLTLLGTLVGIRVPTGVGDVVVIIVIDGTTDG